MASESNEIGQRLRAKRTKDAVTQAQVAEVLALDVSAVSRIEKGTRHLSAFELGVLTEEFGWDPRELLGMEVGGKRALAARIKAAPKTTGYGLDDYLKDMEVEGYLPREDE